jgi:hypothetical protein
MKEYLPIVKGLIKYIPGISHLVRNNPGGGLRGRYYYSVYLRHVLKLKEIGIFNNPKIIAEIGPGDTLGVGICALLLGAEKYYALDVKKYNSVEVNLNILDEISALFTNSINIPDEQEFPKIKPHITKPYLPYSINDIKIFESRTSQIKESLISLIDDKKTSQIEYIVPWTNTDIISPQSIDLIISQAVLEHVNDLDETYKRMSSIIKSGGIISNVIDFKSHGITKQWNGHWRYSPLEWKIIQANKPFLINRHPWSYHHNILLKYGFEIIFQERYRIASNITCKDLASPFKDITSDDLECSGIYFIAQKK